MDSLKLILSKRTFFSPAWVFASLNILTGTWVLYLPYVKTKFTIDDGQIGMALFCFALGLLISIPFIPFINQKIGIGRSTKIGIILLALAYNLPLLAPTYILLCSSLFLIGLFAGFTDVSMNALVSVIEKQTAQNFMSAVHGFFSLGGFLGAGIGSVLILWFSIPAWHMLVISIGIISSNVYLSKYYDTIDDEETKGAQEKQGHKWQSIYPLLGLSMVGFIIMINEGAVEHWSNLFLFDIVKVTESKSGLGFITFSLCMTIGRFFGDALSEKLGAIRIISYGCLIAILAYGFIITSSLVLTVMGFGILGLGLSVVIPELFRLAGKTENVPATVGISIVSGIGFVGFLLGPVLLGFISKLTTLVWSFVFLAFIVVIALAIVFFRLRNRYR